MHFNLLPVLLAGAGVVQYAVASPIRVVVVTSNKDVSTNVSFSPMRPIPIFRPEGSTIETTELQHGAGRHVPCSQLKDKALAWSNRFRAAIGLPPIEPEPLPVPAPFLPPPPNRIPGHMEPDNMIHILPFMGTPEDNARLSKPVPGFVHIGHGHGVSHQRYHHSTFLHRVHRALMTLGPWEGRAVAFVLGCGIGVLLRMFWVVAIVIARAFRRSNPESEEVHDVLVFEADAEEILVPPPQYTDEKVALTATATAEHEIKA